jgi:hypothetical protein
VGLGAAALGEGVDLPAADEFREGDGHVGWDEFSVGLFPGFAFAAGWC